MKASDFMDSNKIDDKPSHFEARKTNPAFSGAFQPSGPRTGDILMRFKSKQKAGNQGQLSTGCFFEISPFCKFV